MSERPAAPQASLLERAGAPLQRFLELEAASTILLLTATGIALVWANSPWAPLYERLLHVPLALRVGPWELELGLEHFVNDALMAVFFFVVGLEIKRELVVGELSSASRALLPVVAAIGGMVVPAGLYAALHWGSPALRGWGIPMATDIAFAVAALSVFGSRVAPGLKVFLLALAIADDIGAVAVIAIFYAGSVSTAWLGAAVAGLALVAALGRAGVRAYAVYGAVGIGVWLAVHASGVHATIAAVALGFLTPARPLDPPAERRDFVRRGVGLLERIGDLLEGNDDRDGHRRHDLAREVSRAARASLSPLDELVHRLHPFVAFVIMPVFALCNAGVPIELAKLALPVPLRVAIGVALGLVVGKPLGITLFAWLAVRLGLAELPRGVGWAQVLATGCLAGIGFTVALFVAALAFEVPDLKGGAKVGILAGSAIATVLGLGLLARTLPRAHLGQS